MAQNFFLKEPAPTKVQIVNEKEDLVEVEVGNLPTNGSNSVWVELRGTQVIRMSLRPGNNQTNIALDNILLLQSDGGFFAIPLNSYFTSLTSAQVTAMLQSFKTAYATLVAGVTAATLHYTRVDAAGAVTSEVYNLKD